MQLLTVYQQISNVLCDLSNQELTVAEAHKQLTDIADLANRTVGTSTGLNIVVPSVVDLQKRYKQTSVFESSEETEPYEESYQSSTC